MTVRQNLLKGYSVKWKLAAWMFATGKSQNLKIALPRIIIHLGNSVMSYDDRAAPALSPFLCVQ